MNSKIKIPENISFLRIGKRLDNKPKLPFIIRQFIQFK